MSDRAISATTSELRIRLPRTLPLSDRPLSFSASLRLNRVACSAGTTPNSTPVRSDAPSVNSRTGTLMPTLLILGMPPGFRLTSSSRPHNASRDPSAPPTTASKTLSVRSWRATRHLPAPSAARIAISRSRAVVRASIRLATFAHAISKTNPTVPSSTSSAGRVLPTMRSYSGVNLI